MRQYEVKFEAVAFINAGLADRIGLREGLIAELIASPPPIEVLSATRLGQVEGA